MYMKSLESGQESFTHCLHKPLEPAKLLCNSTSSDGLTPLPSGVIALRVITTKNCWANFREEIRLWLSAMEEFCWRHCRKIIPWSIEFDYRQVQKLTIKKTAAGISVAQFPPACCAVEAPNLGFLAGAEHSRLTQPSCLTTAWATISYGCSSRACALHVWMSHLPSSPPDSSRWDIKKDNPVIY